MTHSHSSHNANIHPTAVIDAGAIIADTAIIGAYCVIGDKVTIGAGTKLLNHVVVRTHTRIGENNTIYPFATLGEDCQDLKYAGEETWLEIGDNNTIRESCTLHRGTVQDNSLTKVGSNNLLMVNTHIAHDVVVGDNNVLANNVGVAGHVHIGSNIIIGGNAGIHQFCRVDDYSMIGGASLVLKDVMAMVMISGHPAKIQGLNIEGMKRKGWSRDSIKILRQAYQVIYNNGLTTNEAIEQLTIEFLPTEPKVQLMIDSLTYSKRGITR